jgi:hypothetical protein
MGHGIEVELMIRMGHTGHAPGDTTAFVGPAPSRWKL